MLLIHGYFRYCVLSVGIKVNEATIEKWSQLEKKMFYNKKVEKREGKLHITNVYICIHVGNFHISTSLFVRFCLQ